MKKTLILLLMTIIYNGFSQQRKDILLEQWAFTRQDDASFSKEKLNEQNWQSVVVPHDWAIYGPFGINNDRQNVAITQDGQKEAMEHAGRTGGLPFVGVGWYRTHFTVPQYKEGERVVLMFDGAMSQSKVFVNGKEIGFWPYGYNTFYYDVTDEIHPNKENTLAVRLQNEVEQSRWYPGAGLYRNVHLMVLPKTHIPIWGTRISTPKVDKRQAQVSVSVEYPKNADPNKKYQITAILKDSLGNQIKKEVIAQNFDKSGFTGSFWVENPSLWSPEVPNLYALSLVLSEESSSEALDEITQTVGIRKIEIIPDKGMFLNGDPIKFKGVCMHHDLGPLGAAVNEAAIRRQIRILKQMGVNAIRTSHNMPAPELVKAADQMGMMLAVESLDEWKIPKVKNGYNRFFDQWVEKDLTNMVRYYRNHPSVVMWFIGNEVYEQGSADGAKYARRLQDIILKNDNTRYVSNGMDNPNAVLTNNMAATMQVAGFNYRPHLYRKAYSVLPQAIILGSETASTVSSRGVYKFPVERKSMAKYSDHQSSSYDVEHCGWSNLPEDDFIQHDDLPYCIGEFVWTGFDYLGEPTPYYTDWPSHSSLFGIVDLAGIPKDRYYLYRSHWNPSQPTLHILPHWNWEGREGEVTPVFVYTNYPSAELFINGKSQGRQYKKTDVSLEETDNEQAQKSFERQKRYRLMWMNTVYEPGEVKVVAYDSLGKAVAEKSIHTASKADHIVLSADRLKLHADGKDLSFITVSVVDKDGNLVPMANDKVTFKVTGAGTYRASANGDPSCLDLFHKPQMHLFGGKLVAIVQSGKVKGKIIFTAKVKGLASQSIEIQVE